METWNDYIDRAKEITAPKDIQLPPATLLNDSWRKLGTSIQTTLSRNCRRASDKAIVVLLRQRLAPLREDRHYQQSHRRREMCGFYDRSGDEEHGQRRSSSEYLHWTKKCLLRVGKESECSRYSKPSTNMLTPVCFASLQRRDSSLTRTDRIYSRSDEHLEHEPMLSPLQNKTT
jgi:hypothetical protein